MKIQATVLAAFVALAIATPKPSHDGGLEARACGKEYDYCYQGSMCCSGRCDDEAQCL